jgi:hypothetical protein
MEVAFYQKLHDDIVATQHAIADGLYQVDEQLLSYAIDLADDINYKLEDYHQVRKLTAPTRTAMSVLTCLCCGTVVQAVDLRNRLHVVQQETLHQIDVMPDLEVMQELIGRAGQVGLHTPEFNELCNYADLDKEGLAKAQLKSAIRRRDNDRVIQLNIRLKGTHARTHPKLQAKQGAATDSRPLTSRHANRDLLRDVWQLVRAVAVAEGQDAQRVLQGQALWQGEGPHVHVRLEQGTPPRPCSVVRTAGQSVWIPG